MNSVSEIPSRPKAFATSASVSEPFSNNVDAGDITEAPDGPVIVTPLKAVPDDPSIAPTLKPPAAVESVVTTTF